MLYEEGKEMKYKDKKWNIEIFKKGITIFCRCECGNKHDIQLDKKFNFIGRGTELKQKEI